MTFYWWSHWFWITLLSTLLLSTTFVQSYPSQEISLEYNQHGKPVTTVTKLYQTATTITWPTTTATAPAASSATSSETGSRPSSGNIDDNDATDEKAILQDDTIRAEADVAALLQLPSTGVEAESKQKCKVMADESVEAMDDDSNAAQEEGGGEETDVDNGEHKRSVEANIGSVAAAVEAMKAAASAASGEAQKYAADVNEDADEEDASVVEPHVAAVVAATAVAGATDAGVKLKRDSVAEMNNYTNHSSAHVAADSANTTRGTNSGTAHSDILQAIGNNTVSAPAAPRINNAQPPTPTTLAWLSAMAAAATAAANALPAAVTPNGIDREPVTTPQQQQRIPFTLENANKEEELRRAENEHRSRKSKVLSAEYKHINRYINYSSDTKSLLTRSASTAPNDFDDAEESNISSEALAIQRTYFLDAGAISAICFTIFGVCCTVGTIGIVLYRRRYLNKPQALSEPDSSVYIDDSTMRDNSDEMYSLDNDSFLNSLEAMTIQNYWTDTVKHTKL